MTKFHANLLAALTPLITFIARADDPRVALLQKVGIHQHPGPQIPVDLTFTDESGHPVPLKSFFTGRRPVILTLVYYGCPMLCTTVLNDLTDSLSMIPDNPAEQFDILTISFDPTEKPELARRKKDQ